MGYTSGGKDTANLDSSRRTYDIPLHDEIQELWEPSATPFLVFSRGLRKMATGDPKPTRLVHKSGWVDRRFFAGAAGTWSSSVVSNLTVEATVGGSDSVGFLIGGLTCRAKTAGGDTVFVITNVDSQTQIDIEAITASASQNNIADGDEIQVIGTAFARGADKATATYDTTTTEYSYTQIFKTTVDVTGTLRATVTFGMSEYDRLMEDKRAEHLVDIERALLFGARGATALASTTVYSTYGIVSYIEANSSNSTIKTPAYSNYAFDQFIDDMEAWYSLGGNKATDEKLALSGSSVLAFFSKINSGKLWGDAQVNIESRMSEFGVHVTSVRHPFGILHLVHEPLFRGNSTNKFYKDYMCGVDMQNVLYMPLEGNGVSRDTHLVKNLQTSYDKVIHEYRTEAALLPMLSETHALFKFA
jgi:hypothetical protein